LTLQDRIREIQLLAQEWNLSTQELALRAALTFVDDCALVVGVESGEQLLEIAEFVENGPLSPELAKIIDALDSGYDPEVDPRNWVF
jgi:aryl-alcohol dehydrogenase-like predicted oxidoreductase